MVMDQQQEIKLKRNNGKEAIVLALQGKWEEAVAVNKAITESFPNDIEAYNRLGRAYIELGRPDLARQAYSKALELDPYNMIAKKNLQRLAVLKEARPAETTSVAPQHFIEEVGKSGVVNLVQVAPREVLAALVAGDKVNLRVDKTSLLVENGRGGHIGQVEPKRALRLVRLMEGGNRYSAAVSRLGDSLVSVLIREEYQDPSQQGQLSFPPQTVRVLRPYVRGREIPPEDLELEEGEERAPTEAEEAAQQGFEIEGEGELER